MNTWSGLLVVLLLAPAVMVSSPPPWPGIDAVLSALPSSQATRLALNGLSGTSPFPGVWLSVLVLAGWTLAVYAVLLRRLSTREA